MIGVILIICSVVAMAIILSACKVSGDISREEERRSLDD